MKTHGDLPGDGGSDVLGQVLEQRRQLAANLAGAGALVAVMSGKGGVGKSTVTAGLATALAGRGLRVAALDADLNGPCLPRLLGVAGRQPRLDGTRVVPPESDAGIAVLSSEMFLPERSAPLRLAGPAAEAFTWRPTAEATALRQLLAGTRWGRRDVLLVDLPPGAERLPALLGLLPGLAGVLVVTLASPLSIDSVRRSILAAFDQGAPLTGLVENMAARACPNCGADPGAGRRDAVAALAADTGLPVLARIPFDPDLVEAAEAGRPVPAAATTSPESVPERLSAVAALADLAALLLARLPSAGAGRPHLAVPKPGTPTPEVSA